VSLFELAQGTVIKVKCRLCLAQVCDLCLYVAVCDCRAPSWRKVFRVSGRLVPQHEAKSPDLRIPQSHTHTPLRYPDNTPTTTPPPNQRNWRKLVPSTRDAHHAAPSHSGWLPCPRKRRG